MLVTFTLATIAYFSPVLFTGRLMASVSSDALIESFPAYLGPRSLWTDGILLGYPLFADSSRQYWYPLLLLRLIPSSFNAFAILPYVIAAYGMFGFALALTRSRFAAMVAGFAYAFSGFMISHEGQPVISHPAAWTPYLLWAVEELRYQKRLLWIAAGAGAIALMLLGGQPQIALLALTVAVTYAVVSAKGSGVGVWRYAGRIAAMLVLGLGCAGVALIPALELTQASTRTAISFDFFAHFASSLPEIAVRLIFPYFLALSATPLYPMSHVDVGSFSELTLYAGMGTLLLASIGSLCVAEDRRVLFWSFIALLALALATGNALGLAGITYQLPVFNLFRGPGRHAFEFTIAVSILTAYGLASLERTSARASKLLWAIGLCAGLFLSAALILRFDWGGIDGAIRAFVGADPFVLSNPAIWIPLASFVAAAGVLLAYRKLPRAVARTALLTAFAFDWVTFGWGAYWNWDAATPSALIAPASLAPVSEDARRQFQRIYWTPKETSRYGPRPNLVLLWNEPSVDGYTPLQLKTTTALLRDVDTLPGDVALDLAAARYVIGPQETPQVPLAQTFANTDLGFFIGSAPLAVTNEVVLGLPRPVRATRLAVVTALGDSVRTIQGTKIATVLAEDAAGHVTRLNLLAGVNTAEYAHDRSDVLPYVKHAKAPVYRVDSTGIFYRADLRIRDRLPIRKLTFLWNSELKHGALTILKASLIDDRQAIAVPFGALAVYYADPGHWDAQPNPEYAILRNRRALPRAWTVERVANLSDGAAASAIETGKIGGRAFDPRRIGLVDAASPVRPAHFTSGRVHIRTIEQGQMALDVRCRASCFLVTSDTWYPGWIASIDGRAVTLARVDLALRGVAVPSGSHEIRFRYAPFSLKVGEAISFVSVAVLALLVYSQRRTRRV